MFYTATYSQENVSIAVLKPSAAKKSQTSLLETCQKPKSLYGCKERGERDRQATWRSHGDLQPCLVF